jgi:hypothetical protein
MCIYWQIYIDHQQNATFVRNTEKLKKLSLLKITLNTWDILTKGTEWTIAIQLVREHTSGQKELFFHLLDLAILNSDIIVTLW